MGNSFAEGLIPELGQRPISAFFYGASRPLLNWVLYATLIRSDPDFFWTDVRLPEEVLDPLDPLARHVVPDRQSSVVPPEGLPRSTTPSAALSHMIRPDEPAESMQRIVSFLQLPTHTQDVISRAASSHRTPVLGLSNAHRIAAHYPGDAPARTVKAILSAGASLVLTWADAKPTTASAFDFVLGLDGLSPTHWKEAVLRCERGNSSGPVREGRRHALGELPAVAEVLGPLGISKR
jgi:hypothetical protein